MATRTMPRKITLMEAAQPLQATVSHDTFSPQKLTGTSLGEQHRRQRLRDDWQPRGFERYQYQKGLLESMNTLGTIGDDEQLTDQKRFEPISGCVESLDCHCEGR